MIEFLLIPLAALSVLGIEEYGLSKEECMAAGFVPESLHCGSCDKLRDFNLEQLMTDCQSCCIKEEEFVHEKYPYAFLDVCDCNLARFPQIQAFVHKDMASRWYGKVKVRQVRGVKPRVLLQDHDGKVHETLNVEKWDTDTLTEFFDQYIE